MFIEASVAPANASRSAEPRLPGHAAANSVMPMQIASENWSCLHNAALVNDHARCDTWYRRTDDIPADLGSRDDITGQGSYPGQGWIMQQITTLFITTSTTLLANINPLEVMPVFLKLLPTKAGKCIGTSHGAPASAPRHYCSSF